MNTTLLPPLVLVWSVALKVIVLLPAVKFASEFTNFTPCSTA
jgi:hypothetical protein